MSIVGLELCIIRTVWAASAQERDENAEGNTCTFSTFSVQLTFSSVFLLNLLVVIDKDLFGR